MSTGMKKAVLRDNMRKTKTSNHNQKNIQSQSPPHKKLLKKIEMTHKEPTHKYDFSLQENLLQPEPKEEAVDFRVEIERRFQRSIANKIYVFPKNGPDAKSANDDSNSSSLNSSLESIKHVTIYDLSSQNHKKPKPVTKTAPPLSHTQTLQTALSPTNAKNKTLNIDTNLDDFEDEASGVPLEVRIRDKSSSAYKKLLGLLEKQLSHTPNPNPAQGINYQIPVIPSTTAAAQPLKASNNNVPINNNNTSSKKEIEVIGDKTGTLHKTRDSDVKSQERYKAPSGVSDLKNQSNSHVNSSQNFKKTLSSEKVSSKFDTTSTTISLLEKSLGNIGSSSTKATTIDVSKLTHDSIKKIYGNSLIKSVTPQYINNKTVGNFKENIFRTYTQENYPSKTPTNNTSSQKAPLTALYQKAQNEVLNKTNRIGTTTTSAKPTKQFSNSNLNSMLSTKREETPKDHTRKIAFNNFFGSPEPEKASMLATMTSLSNLSKKNSTKAIQIMSPSKKVAPNASGFINTSTSHNNTGNVSTNMNAEKANKESEKQIYMSYDFAHSKVVKKPAFKLDLSKRSNNGHAARDTLSSARNRNNKTSNPGYSEVMNTESLFRTSYDVQQYSSILNSSSQRTSNAKKGASFTPTSNTMKNLSFSKVNLINK